MIFLLLVNFVVANHLRGLTFQVIRNQEMIYNFLEVLKIIFRISEFRNLQKKILINVKFTNIKVRVENKVKITGDYKKL